MKICCTFFVHFNFFSALLSYSSIIKLFHINLFNQSSFFVCSFLCQCKTLSTTASWYRSSKPSWTRWGRSERCTCQRGSRRSRSARPPRRSTRSSSTTAKPRSGVSSSKLRWVLTFQLVNRLFLVWAKGFFFLFGRWVGFKNGNKRVLKC